MTSPENTIDPLLQRLRLGDQHALADLFGQHRERLRSMIAFRMDPRVRGRVDPSDVLQDAFVTIAERQQEFTPEKQISFFVWVRSLTMECLLRTHRTHITTHKRDVRREVHLPLLDANATSLSISLSLLANDSSISERVSRKEQQQCLLKLLAEMDATEREIVALRVFEGLSNGEAAEVLGLTKQTASKHLIRALKQLRSAMDAADLAEYFKHG